MVNLRVKRLLITKTAVRDYGDTRITCGPLETTCHRLIAIALSVYRVFLTAS